MINLREGPPSRFAAQETPNTDTMHRDHTLVCYLIFLRIWSNGDSSPLGDVSLG
jgi:hypothetical protein